MWVVCDDLGATSDGGSEKRRIKYLNCSEKSIMFINFNQGKNAYDNSFNR